MRCSARCGTSPCKRRSRRVSPSRRPGGPGDTASGRRGRGAGRRGRGGEDRRPEDTRPDEPEDRGRPLPYRVTRWGKFWSLEPLSADVRSYLVAKGGPPPQLDDLVLAVPTHGDRRRIVAVIGPSGDVKAVLRALLHAKGVRQGFSAGVLEEAAAVKGRAARPDNGRRDLTALPTFTIDPDTARDFDDAVSVAREGTGYRAHVHIADVSYFVDDDGEIEREARRRTSSLYLPLFAEPMLPAALSSDLCSLVPRQPRKCVTVEFTFDAQGRRTSTQYYRALISSDHRLTYGFADTVIGPAGVAAADGAADTDAAADDGPQPADPKAAVAALPGAHLVAGRPEPPRDVPDATMEADDALREQLLLAAELAGVLRRRRLARGALTIGSFEPEYAFDHAGALSGAAARPETPSHALVEEFMLAANEAVAEYLLRKRAHTLYRVHEPPEPASTRELFEQLEELGVATPPFPAGDGVPAAQLQQLYGRLSGLVVQTSAREHRGSLAWSTLVLRSLKQARYAPVNLGHFGLASPAYLHFTSPIRRYPDLVAHRALLYHLGEGGSELGDAELAAAAEDCSTRERDFGRIELTGDDVALCFLLDRRLDEEGWEQVFGGEIVGLVGGGLFVRFGDVFEGFLSSRRLGGERFEVSEHETALVGEATGARYRLGDAFEVKVERVDRLSGKVDLAPAHPPAGRSVTGPNRRPARRTTGSRPPRRRAPGRETHRKHR
jgi:ribonuclease R